MATAQTANSGLQIRHLLSIIAYTFATIVCATTILTQPIESRLDSMGIFGEGVSLVRSILWFPIASPLIATHSLRVVSESLILALLYSAVLPWPLLLPTASGAQKVHSVLKRVAIAHGFCILLAFLVSLVWVFIVVGRSGIGGPNN